MEPIENLFYALGEFAYAIAFADGKIQEEEKNALKAILESEFKNRRKEYDYSEMIFEILESDKTETVESAYNIALKELKMNGHYLSPDLKEKFLRILQKVSDAFPPRTNEESFLIDKFIKDMFSIKGDPIYYAQHQISNQ